ncbi:hypothetical protein [Mucilaginibacter sp. SJ]|uniref:hypothetical protein n=1 Tax=Mucilaginibacter sp. SJ TaxID=3029053 RepID=UPI0023A9C635|nr:hypothetical protein [Mucilaginibacter sp. SJ]WEA01781.1 hypothetical protein MusilaSJ_02445 [Mucilaginibacter sp. SJ]
MGDTVLLIDLKQLVIPTYLTEGGVPVTFDRQMYSLISGVQWHTAFGREGDPIYKQPNFEGSANLDGRLERNGILLDHEYIKAVIFFEYRLSDKEPKFLGLYRSRNITQGVRTFLYQVCDFINDELNSEGWQNNRILFGDQDSK